MADTPLEKVPGWSQAQVARLKDSWITSAEQVVALSATQGGLQSLAEHLAISEAEAQHLVTAAQSALPATTQAALKRGNDTNDYGLGALPLP